MPFTWTLHLLPEWLFVNAILLADYFALNVYYHAQKPATSVRLDHAEIEPLGLRGAANFVWFAVIIAAVAFAPSVDAEAIETGHATVMDWVPLREIIMLGAALCSYRFGNYEIGRASCRERV